MRNKSMKIKVNPTMMEEAIFVGQEHGEVFVYNGVPGQHPQEVAAGWGAECIGYEFIPVALEEMTEIPAGHELLIKEKGTDKMYVLYGFDEVDEFKNVIKNPVYGFGASVTGRNNLNLFEFVEDLQMYQAWVDALPQFAHLAK